MKQAKVRLDVVVDIKDEKVNPDGSKTAPIRVHTGFRERLKGFLYEKKMKDFKEFSELLDQYVELAILEAAGVPFTPLTMEEALKLKDCEIVEGGENGDNR